MLFTKQRQSKLIPILCPAKFLELFQTIAKLFLHTGQCGIVRVIVEPCENLLRQFQIGFEEETIFPMLHQLTDAVSP